MRGLQMLGGAVLDPHGVEGTAIGLGLLPFVTEMQSAKRYSRGVYRLGALRHYWARLSGVSFGGYEIRHGHTQITGKSGDALRSILAEGCGWQQGRTQALYTHGLFENSAVMHTLFKSSCPTLDGALGGLADFIEDHIEATTLKALLDARV